MWQIDGEEDCVLTWGDLIDMSVIDEFLNDNPCSDVWLNYQKSADAIVLETL